MVYYMELNQGEIIQKPKMQELSSLFMTHRLIVMYAPVKFHEYTVLDTPKINVVAQKLNSPKF